MQAKAGTGVFVAGTVTKDAEYKTIGENGTPLVSFSLAINARGQDAAYANCKAFGGVLANYARSIKKGDAVFAVGIIETREYNGKTYNDLNCQWLNFIGKVGVSPSPSPAPYTTPMPGHSAVQADNSFDDDYHLTPDDDLPF